MKKLSTITLVIFLSLFFVSTIIVSAQTAKKGNKIRSHAPETQIVNNSGKTIYKAKVGTIVFSNKLPDGSSTGFKNVLTGTNRISVKFSQLSPWEKIGTLGKFEKGKNYAVNIYFLKDKSLCASLALRHDTDATFDADTAKKIIDRTCKKRRPGLIAPE